MADTRPLTSEEEAYYRSIGEDPTGFKMPVTSAPPQDNGVSIPGTVGRVAKAHAGGYLGGAGGLAAASWLLGPEVGLPTSLIVGGLAAAGGGYAGQKAQDIAQGEEATQRLQQEAAEAAQQHPLVAGATDISAAALLSGGSPSLRNIPRAARGLLGKTALSEADQLALSQVGREALSPSGLATTAENAANSEALQKVALSSVVNPAINTGIGMALGQTPTIGDLASQVAGGALFSNQSKWGKFIMGHSGEPAPEQTAKEIPTRPVDETTGQTIPEKGAGPQSPYSHIDSEGNPLIDDNSVKMQYAKTLNQKPDYSKMSDEDGLAARTAYRTKLSQSADDMRQQLHEKWLADQQKLDAVKIPTQPTIEPTQKDTTGATGAEMPQSTNLGDRAGAESVKSTGYSPDEISQLQSRKDDVAKAVKDWQQEQLLNGPASQHPDVIDAEQKAKTAAQRLSDFQAALKEKHQQDLAEIQGNNVARPEERPKVNLSKVTPEGEQLPAGLNEAERIQEQLERRSAKAPMEDDTEQYQKLYGKMKGLIQSGDHSSPEFRETWQQLEALKNKNGGMPPGQQSAAKSPIGMPPSDSTTPHLTNYIATRRATVKGVLQHIAASDSPFAKLAQHHLNSGDKTLNTPVRITNMPDGRSLYNPASETIRMDPSQVSDHRVLMHEIGHALLMDKLPGFGHATGAELHSLIQEYINHPKVNPAIKEFLKTYVDTVNALGLGEKYFTDRTVQRGELKVTGRGLAGFPDRAQQAHGVTGYAISNPDEFATMLLHDNRFQKVLNELPSGQQDGKSMWTRIVEAVRHILGVPVKQGSMLERALKATDELSGGGKTEKTISEEGIKQAPKEESPLERDRPRMGGLENLTRGMIDKIRDIPHPLAGKVADAFDRTLTERQERVGATWNKLKGVIDKVGMTKQDEAALQRISQYENEHKSAAPVEMFTSQRVRDIYTTERQIYDESGKYRLKNGEPVYREGKPTSLQQDPFAHPTTPNPKVVETYKANADKEEMARLDKVFLENGVKHGLSLDEAKEHLQNFKVGIQGSLANEGGNMQFYNAARRSQGIPLPEEFTRSGYQQNLEAYYHRQATDNTFYKNVENNPAVMSALGETKDAWNRPIPRDPSGGIAANSAVKAQLREFQGEVGGMSFHNERAVSALATTLFVASPALEVHKVGSNLIKLSSMQDNPVQTFRLWNAMIKNFGEGLQHAKENNVMKLSSRSLTDFWNSNTTLAERMQSLAQGIRKVTSLNDLTNKFSTGLMQAGAEYTIPLKVQQALKGDHTAQQLLLKLDPSYQKGKTYTQEEMQKLASVAVGYLHGTGDGRTMPAWMTGDTEMSGFFKLAHWSVAQTNNFMTDVYTPALKGDYKPLINSLFGAAVGGYLIREIREKLQGKHGQIPSLDEIANSEQGLSGNKGLLAYNLMASMQYAGFGGLLSQVMKYPFDFAYKNTPHGATFPLDEVASDMAHTLSEVSTAIANDKNIDWGKMVQAITGHVLTTNVQLGRVAYNNMINAGLITGSVAEKKELADKMGQLRRFNMVTGLPYAETEQEGSNPYMDLEQKRFKQTQDVGEAMKMLPQLVNNIVQQNRNNPDVMMEKLKGLKENQYATMPSMDTMPLSFMKYLGYLQREEGPEAAHAQLLDYMKHRAINEAKSSVVP